LAFKELHEDNSMKMENRRKRTIDIYQMDFNYLNAVRTTSFGKVSFANAVKELARVHRLALEKGLITSDIITIVTKEINPPEEVP